MLLWLGSEFVLFVIKWSVFALFLVIFYFLSLFLFLADIMCFSCVLCCFGQLLAVKLRLVMLFFLLMRIYLYFGVLI